MASRKVRTSVPWLDTAIEIAQVLSLDEHHRLSLGGKPVSDNQLLQLKSDAELLGKISLWPLLIETVRAQAISVGINKSQNFDHVLTAKAMLLLADMQKAWVETIRKARPLKVNNPK